MKLIKKRKTRNTVESFCGCGKCGKCVGQTSIGAAETISATNISTATQSTNCP